MQNLYKATYIYRGKEREDYARSLPILMARVAKLQGEAVAYFRWSEHMTTYLVLKVGK